MLDYAPEKKGKTSEPATLRLSAEIYGETNNIYNKNAFQ